LSYSLGTALDMWGLWLYPAVAFAVFNMYLGVSPLQYYTVNLSTLYDTQNGEKKMSKLITFILDNFGDLVITILT